MNGKEISLCYLDVALVDSNLLAGGSYKYDSLLSHFYSEMRVMLMDCLGFIASALLILSSVPQAIHTLKTKDVNGLSLCTLIFWFCGVISMGIYVAVRTPQFPLLLNYGFNTVVVGLNLLLYFKYKPLCEQKVKKRVSVRKLKSGKRRKV